MSRLPLQRARDRLAEHSCEWIPHSPHAAVLVALTEEDEPSVILVKRAANLRLHAGEMAFPGGMREAVDASRWETALREAEEEIALPREQVVPLGCLHPLRTRTGIQVHPCVGHIPTGLTHQPDPGELAAVFEVPLGFFARHDNLHLDRMSYHDSVVYVPRYEWRGETIWGVTAAVLAQLVNETHDAGLDLRRDWNSE